ncbi:MAG TPA: Imm21 family immunity protein [Tepidisphaeraceae bacterium]|nr:Imm21 family immunity protein [Tepidisphaeraceae bacterium]
MGRKLIESEKVCVQVELKDGLPSGSVASPLSDLLEQRKAQLEQSQETAKSGAAAGMTKYQYLAADGGPHMLLPVCAAGSWKGASSTADVLNPSSDYGRACAATGTSPIAVIPVGASSALVFANPPMTSWGKSSDGLIEVYGLNSWTSINLDAFISKASAAMSTASLKDLGSVIQISEPDAFLLFAGDTPGSTAYGVYRIPLPRGKYHVLLGTYSANGDSVTICRLKP